MVDKNWERRRDPVKDVDEEGREITRPPTEEELAEIRKLTRERIYRYQVLKLAERFGQLPEEIEEMDSAWFYDCILFADTEATYRRSKASG